MASALKGMLVRYILLVLACVPFMQQLASSIITKTTIHAVYSILSIFYSNTALLASNTLFFGNGWYLTLIVACTAPAAYGLLFILHMLTPLPKRQQWKALLFSLVVFFCLNLIRIFIFTTLYVKGSNYFELGHQMVWYFGSTLLLVVIWFATVYRYDIQTLPVYTDIHTLITAIRKKR